MVVMRHQINQLYIGHVVVGGLLFVFRPWHLLSYERMNVLNVYRKTETEAWPNAHQRGLPPEKREHYVLARIGDDNVEEYIWDLSGDAPYTSDLMGAAMLLSETSAIKHRIGDEYVAKVTFNEAGYPVSCERVPEEDID